MSEAGLKEWIARNTGAAGVLAFGVHAPGKSTYVQPCTDGLPAPGLENAWRCVAETIPVLQLNRFPTARFRFVYGEAVVHCERGRDGTCLGVFAQRNQELCPQAEVDRLLAEFHKLV